MDGACHVKKATLAIGCFLTTPWIISPGFAADFDLPQGPGHDLVLGQCQTCHDLQSVVDSAGIGKGAWDAVLDNMKSFGMRISDDQRAQILAYLGTYLGPNPPPVPEKDELKKAAADGTAVKAKLPDGKPVFENTCAACHQTTGKGVPGQFPPLAGNHDLFLSTEYPAEVILNGLQGKVEVDGKSYDSAMPAFNFLSDDEIAAVVGYVRSSWGNGELQGGKAEALSPADIKKLRSQKLTPDQVYALRKSLEH